MEKPVDEHIFVFNGTENGGEQLILKTKIYDNGDDNNNIFLIQELELNSYSNSVSFNLSGLLTPDVLRKLANELDKAICKNMKGNSK